MKEYLNKDLYDILGITPDVDEVKIKVAYRKMARMYHPDVNNNTPESIKKFKEITEAYEILLDVKRRKEYDTLRGYTKRKTENTETNRSQAQRAYSSVAQEKPKQQKPEKKESFSKVFNTILDGLFQNENAHKEEKKKKKPENGRNINLSVSIKIEEAINGTTRTVNVLHTEKCPKCEGRRFINGAKCPMCKGSGEISIHKRLNVKIPAGVKKGARIRVANEGDKGYYGGKNGDLFLTVEVEDSSLFKFDGLNVLCEIPITPYEAALGASIEIPGVCGNISMRIPPLTTSGQKFRISGQGLKDEKKNKSGDQIVTVKIEMPKDLSDKEKELYEELKKYSTQKIRENLK